MKLAIIGGGFTGGILTRQLVEKEKFTDIYLFNKDTKFTRGIAYQCSEENILNVVAAKMSAFSDKPDHFLNWVMEQKSFANADRNIVAGAFLSRELYGEYLDTIWNETKLLAKEKQIHLHALKEEVLAITKHEKGFLIQSNEHQYEVDKVVIATGNELPGNPKVKDLAFTTSSRYFQNPWNVPFEKMDNQLPILIIGNGLTMVDNLLNLRKHHLSQKVISVSPNGFNILPHRNFNFKYDGPLNHLPEKISLHELVSLFNRENKKLKQFGMSAEPLIDALRPKTQQLWQQFTDEEKQLFMRRLRHIWGVARHRIPFVSYDFVLKEQINERLEIVAGKPISIAMKNEGFEVVIYNRKKHKEETLEVGYIINCTGPETAITKTNHTLLNQLLSNGLISQDKLQLGISVNPRTFQTINASGNLEKDLFAIGGILKGTLWESTAINELRIQCENLADVLNNVQ